MNEPLPPLDLTGLLASVTVVYGDRIQSMLDAGNNAFAASVKAALADGKKAANLTLAFKFTVGRDKEIIVSGAIQTKDPKPDPRPAILFTDQVGRIFLEDPRQNQFEFGENVTPINKGGK